MLGVCGGQGVLGVRAGGGHGYRDALSSGIRDPRIRDKNLITRLLVKCCVKYTPPIIPSHSGWPNTVVSREKPLESPWKRK